MYSNTLTPILETLDSEKIHYAYSQDEFARFLLRQKISRPTKLGEVKKGPFGRFLNRPSIRHRLEASGDGYLHPHQLQRWNGLRPDKELWFKLSFGKWGSERHWTPWYHQTSRMGYNLVLRLNFSNQHNQPFSKILGMENCEDFRFFCHPVDREALTLSWARIDLDEDLNEALIEEVQSDWVREVHSDLNDLENESALSLRYMDCYGRNGLQQIRRMRFYHHHLLKPYRELWQEATLSAALWFLVKRIGVKAVYYHSNESLAAYKDLDITSRPPRSIYRDLPQRFGFKVTHQRPKFLEWDRCIQSQQAGRNRKGFSKRRHRMEVEELNKSRTPMYVMRF